MGAASMRETEIIRQLMQNWKRQRPDMLWWHKIADPRFGGHVTNERAVDVIACFQGICVGMEWKLKKDTRAFPLNRVRLGQLETLCDIHLASGVALLMIVEYITPQNKCLYAIPVDRWNCEVAKITDRKSIRLEEHFLDCLNTRIGRNNFFQTDSICQQ